MSRFFVSDLHFGHRNIIEYCDRPYSSIEEMDIAIIEQWNKQVNPDDEVWFLGDFGINKKKCLDKELLNQLNGSKNIVLGNHDLGFVHGHQGKEKFTTTKQKLLDAGWKSVHLKTELTLSSGHHVVLTHLPPSNECDNRYSQFKVPNNPFQYYIHGHLHGNYRKNKNLIDVAFDGELKLLTEDDLNAIIDDPRDFIPTRLTNKFKNEVALNLMPFEEEVKKKNLRRVVSDDKKLVLYNYTDQCTYDRAWNEVTRASRGIIFERETGKLVALPFEKFFNVFEQPETRLENLPDEPYVVTEKMDGSMGIIYHYDGEWRVATRGSFTSVQAKRGQEILKKYDMTERPYKLTLLVEIIYPENKIVANYGDREELVLLTAFNRNTQVESQPLELDLISGETGIPIVEEFKYTINEMIELQETLPKDEEGFVVRFESGLRVKIKGREYLRIHKMISHMTPLAFWETMKEGIVDVAYLEELPEEYRKEADDIVDKLQDRYAETFNDVYISYLSTMMHLNIDMMKEVTKDDKRKLGMYIQKYKPVHSSSFFTLLNNNEAAAERYVLKLIRPTGNIL